MNYELRTLIETLNENGIHVIADRSFDKIEFDFFEHDKKVTEEKDGEIRELKRLLEVLEEIIADANKPDISVDRECGGYHLAKERIAELERELKEYKDEVIAVCKNRDEMMEGFRNGIKPYVDLCQMHETIAELRDRHQSDCIEINRLNVALEVITEKYMKLREVHGL